MANIKRLTAKKCRIKDLLNGRYIKREGWEPNYIETTFGKISRTNILGIIVSLEKDFLAVDDGTGIIQIRTFGENKKILGKKVGDIVLIIGKPREFDKKKYLVPEIIKKIDNPKWIKYRAIELASHEQTKITKAKDLPKKLSDTNLSDSLIKKIAELDTGTGVKISEVLNFFNSKDTNNKISQLIENGDLFEIKPGIIKII